MVANSKKSFGDVKDSQIGINCIIPWCIYHFSTKTHSYVEEKMHLDTKIKTKSINPLQCMYHTSNSLDSWAAWTTFESSFSRGQRLFCQNDGRLCYRGNSIRQLKCETKGKSQRIFVRLKLQKKEKNSRAEIGQTAFSLFTRISLHKPFVVLKSSKITFTFIHIQRHYHHQ